MEFQRLIPELTVSDIAATKAFYLELLGFHVAYERPAEKFAFLSLDGVQLMVEEYHKDGWNVAPLQRPFGRGVNFSIELEDIDPIYQRLLAQGNPLFRPMMENHYEAEGGLLSQREFLVQDPDGYLLRFTQA